MSRNLNTQVSSRQADLAAVIDRELRVIEQRTQQITLVIKILQLKLDEVWRELRIKEIEILRQLNDKEIQIWEKEVEGECKKLAEDIQKLKSFSIKFQSYKESCQQHYTVDLHDQVLSLSKDCVPLEREVLSLHAKFTQDAVPGITGYLTKVKTMHSEKLKLDEKISVCDQHVGTFKLEVANYDRYIQDRKTLIQEIEGYIAEKKLDKLEEFYGKLVENFKLLKPAFTHINNAYKAYASAVAEISIPSAAEQDARYNEHQDILQTSTDKKNKINRDFSQNLRLYISENHSLLERINGLKASIRPKAKIQTPEQLLASALAAENSDLEILNSKKANIVAFLKNKKNEIENQKGCFAWLFLSDDKNKVKKEAIGFYLEEIIKLDLSKPEQKNGLYKILQDMFKKDGNGRYENKGKELFQHRNRIFRMGSSKTEKKMEEFFINMPYLNK